MLKDKFKFIFLLFFVSCIMLLSCMPQIRNKIIKLSCTFNPCEIRWFTEKQGNNTIKGQAFLRTIGGYIRTCAGYDVLLVPFSSYAKERILHLYGNTKRGFRNITSPYV